MNRDDPGVDYDPSEALRRRVVNQVSGDSSDPVAPAVDTSAAPVSPVDPAPFDAAQGDGGYTPPDPPPFVPQGYQPEQQGVTDPSPQSPSPQDPNSAAALAEQNRIYGPGGTAYNPPSPTSTFDPNSGGWNAPTPTQTTAPSGYAGGGDQSILSLLQSGMSPQQASQIFNQKNGRSTGNEAVYYNDQRGQTIGLPSGYAALTPGGWTWTVRTPEGPAAAPTQQGAPVARSGAQTSYYTPANVSAGLPQTNQMNVAGLQAPQGLWNQDFIAQLRAALMQRLSADSAQVDPNDANIASPLSAAKDQLSRNSDTERNALAERLYAQGGLNTDAVNQGIQQSSERTGTALSSLRANLIVSELKSRRDDLASAMQLAVQAGDAESAQNIQLQLSALNAQIQREGIGANLAIAGQQFNQSASNTVTG